MISAICLWVGPIVLIVGIAQMSCGADDGPGWLIAGIAMVLYGIISAIKRIK